MTDLDTIVLDPARAALREETDRTVITFGQPSDIVIDRPLPSAEKRRARRQAQRLMTSARLSIGLGIQFMRACEQRRLNLKGKR